MTRLDLQFRKNDSTHNLENSLQWEKDGRRKGKRRGERKGGLRRREREGVRERESTTSCPSVVPRWALFVRNSLHSSEINIITTLQRKRLKVSEVVTAQCT